MIQDSDNLIWVDLEMTGLDPDHDKVIEIATIVTNSQLEILDEGPVMAIHQSEQVLDSMDEWNTTHHTQSGLVERVRQSHFNETDASTATIDFLSRWIQPGLSPMCGNSICQDRRFMARHLPELERYFHYRNLDVSSIKELAKRWTPDIAKGFRKESAHLALSDIRDSIAELRYYRAMLFIEAAR